MFPIFGSRGRKGWLTASLCVCSGGIQKLRIAGVRVPVGKGRKCDAAFAVVDDPASVWYLEGVGDTRLEMQSVKSAGHCEADFLFHACTP